MEIFTWTCAMSTVAMQQGWLTAPPISLETGSDLPTPGARRRAWAAYQSFRPDLVVMASPCT
eukprot:9083173-Lingulodinium_polyedra.AAC.1